MSKNNISLDMIETEVDIEGCNETTPCFCQGDAICVFCLKDKQTIEKDLWGFEEFQINENDEVFSRKINYTINFTVKQLTLICDYYGILKRNRNKSELIESIVNFESNPKNAVVVFQRKKMWFYLEELKKDAFLKKYIWIL